MEFDLNKLQALIERGVTVDVDGKKWSTQKLSPVIYDPAPAAIEICTLTGLRDYLKSEIDHTKEDAKNLFVVVEGHDRVTVQAKLTENMVRKEYVVAKLGEQRSFPFSQFQELEPFIIGLKSQFKSSEVRESLIQFLSKITSGETLSVADDGVSQQVTMSRGTSGALKENQKAPSGVILTPFRTFREIEQPSSEFIFRLRGGRALPECNLIEADGGAWKLKAMESIATWLKAEIPGVTVLS